MGKVTGGAYRMVVIWGPSLTWFCEEVLFADYCFMVPKEHHKTLGFAGKKCLVSSAETRHVGRIKISAPAPHLSQISFSI